MKRLVQSLLVMLILILPMVAKELVIPSPEDAFSYSVKKVDDALLINVTPANNIYLYDDKFKFEITKPKVVDLTKLIKLQPATKFKKWQVHFEPVNVKIPLSLIKQNIDGDKFTFKLTFQGCTREGVCYAPISHEYDFNLSPTNSVAPLTTVDNSNLTQEDVIANSLRNNSTFIVIAMFFGFGLLLSLTPCVFPMIPILSSIIVAQSNEDGKISTKRAFFLSLVYVLSMALAYTIAGVLAGLFGTNIQVLLQNPWVVGAFSLFFVFLAFSMFGFYDLQMPKFIQNRLSKTSNDSKSKGVIGVAIMGFLSALIVGPCVAAPLAGALVYIGQTGDAVLGGIALFVMSLGLGVPLLLVGLGAGKYMPKPGQWMNTIKAVFGAIMLGVAIWMLSKVVSGNIIIFMWAFLAIGSAIYLGALEPIKGHVTGWKKLLKSLAVILLVYSVMLFIGAFTNSTNPLNPLERFNSTPVIVGSVGEIVKKKTSPFTRVPTLKELKKIIKESKKPVVLDFYADWCTTCIELENYTFSDAKVREKFKDFTALQIDVTKNSDEDLKIEREFGLFGPPAILFFRNGTEIKPKRIIGFIDAEKFLIHLNSI